MTLPAGHYEGTLATAPNGAPVVLVGGAQPSIYPELAIDAASEHQTHQVHVVTIPQDPDHLQLLVLLDGYMICPGCQGWTFTPCYCGRCHRCCTGTR